MLLTEKIEYKKLDNSPNNNWHLVDKEEEIIVNIMKSKKYYKIDESSISAMIIFQYQV